ncbi:hypothetical protein E2C01_006983 [Portunus trituberculatus]|uniref:Transmembrane protein n=1 Tax=Portunus trituberculatus TaxID=210409 RepID=A0A5B7D398_PORTR|nr:hypothetical protein [Portunus trituberculatus]
MSLTPPRDATLSCSTCRRSETASSLFPVSSSSVAMLPARLRFEARAMARKCLAKSLRTGPALRSLTRFTLESRRMVEGRFFVLLMLFLFAICASTCSFRFRRISSLANTAGPCRWEVSRRCSLPNTLATSSKSSSKHSMWRSEEKYVLRSVLVEIP